MDSFHDKRIARLLDDEAHFKSKYDKESKKSKKSQTSSNEELLKKAFQKHEDEKKLIEMSILSYQQESPYHPILEVLEDYLKAFNKGDADKMRSIRSYTLVFHSKRLSNFYKKV